MGKISPDIALTIKDANSISSSSLQMLPPTLQLQPPYTTEALDGYRNQCLPLYKAVLKADWGVAEQIINKYPDVVRARITAGGETALHLSVAAGRVGFAEKLVERMNQKDLEIQNYIGNTVLCFSAANGNVGVAEMMVAKNTKLPIVRGPNAVSPLYIAALSGHRDMVKYLLPLSEVRTWTESERASLLTTCIFTSLFDVALFMIEDDSKLTVAEDQNGETALHVLARLPMAFADIQRTWMSFLSFRMKEAHNRHLVQTQAIQLVRCLLGHILQQDVQGTSKLIGEAPQLLFTAAELGNTEFLIELISCFPDLIWKLDRRNRTIFHVAISKRHHGIFNLLHEIGSLKTLIATYRDDDDNNMLHLAAALPCPENFRGAALHMQQEIMWFKEVERVVQPLYREMKNKDGETPRAIFSKNHKVLMREGEKWMKDMAKSSSVVAILIAAVVFTMVFTMPVGNKNAPWSLSFPRQKSMGFFSISEGVALFSSSISLAMFLSILTSCFSENDFLDSLPLKLMLGLTTLFISVLATMIGCFTTFLLPYNGELVWDRVLLGLLACSPVIYVSLEYPLLVDVIRSTYGSRHLFQPSKRLFNQQ